MIDATKRAVRDPVAKKAELATRTTSADGKTGSIGTETGVFRVSSAGVVSRKSFS